MGRKTGTARELFEAYGRGTGHPVMVRAAGTWWDENYCFVIERISIWGNAIGHEYFNGRQANERTFRPGTVFEIHDCAWDDEVCAYYPGTSPIKTAGTAVASGRTSASEEQELLKQLQAMVDQLEKKVRQLMDENSSLKKRLEELTAQQKKTAVSLVAEKKTPVYSSNTKKTVTTGKTGNTGSSQPAKKTSGPAGKQTKTAYSSGRTAETAVEERRSCKTCREYKIGECNGMRDSNTCSDYYAMPSASDAEREMWPTEMKASYYRRRDAEKHGER